MTLRTRLTVQLGLEHPIILAPMGVAASGRLAAAVANAGGLGLVGVGYRGKDWIESGFDAAGNVSVGAGFLTWYLERTPELLDVALERRPSAICLSFGDPRPFAPRIHAASVPLICQVQNLAQARQAKEASAKIIVAQGTEAGGHGATRGMSTLVPEIADLLARESPETLLCAAGGIADGRGLAAALLLGADGVLMGSRLWASSEANVHPKFHQAVLTADGDATVRSTVMDVVRSYDWPKPYTARVLKNKFVDRWSGREPELATVADVELAKWNQAWEAGDWDNTGLFISESVGLIRSIEPVATIIRKIVADAEAALQKTASKIGA